MTNSELIILLLQQPENVQVVIWDKDQEGHRVIEGITVISANKAIPIIELIYNGD